MLAKVLEEHEGNHYIGKNVFIKIPAWFDENEKSIDRPQSHPYPRVKNLKSIIFDVMRNEDFLLNIEEFVSFLTIKVPGKKLEKYGDVISIPEFQ